MRTEFKAIPVGDEGLYAIQRTADGEVSYMSASIDHKTIGTYSLPLAEGTCMLLRAARYKPNAWLPWHTDHLNYRKPVTMYATRVVSAFDHSGRA